MLLIVFAFVFRFVLGERERMSDPEKESVEQIEQQKTETSDKNETSTRSYNNESWAAPAVPIDAGVESASTDSQPTALEQIRDLQPRLIAAIQSSSWAEADILLTSFLTCLESELERPFSLKSILDVHTLTGLMFLAYHDHSLILHRLKRSHDALRAIHYGLGQFEEEESEQIDLPDAESEEAVVDTLDGQTGIVHTTKERQLLNLLSTRGSSKRAKRVRQIMFTPMVHTAKPPSTSSSATSTDTPADAADSSLPFHDVLLDRFALSHLQLPPTGSTTRMAADELLSAGVTRSSLYIPILLRRFVILLETTSTMESNQRHIERLLHASNELMALVHETSSQREVALDEVESELLSGRSIDTITIRNRFTRLTQIHSTLVLRLCLSKRVSQIETLKEEGTLQFSSGGFARALTLYDRAIELSSELEALLDSPDTCPSPIWVEVAAGAPQQNEIFGTALPCWTRTSLTWMKIQLYANASAAALKIDTDDAAENAKEYAENGLHRCEAFIRVEETIRTIVRTIPTVTTIDDGASDDECDDALTRVYRSQPELSRHVPSVAQIHALQSKLFFRHGAACFELDRKAHDDDGDDGDDGRASDHTDAGKMYQLAEQSWKLALQLQPDEKVKREIQARRQRREREMKSKQQQKQQQQQQQPQQQQHPSPAASLSSSDPA